MPARHDIRKSDVMMRRLHGTLAAAAQRGPADFPALLLTPGVGARTVEALAIVAEVVHGAPYRFRDPARFAMAHGGKDRHPFPVPLKTYDESIGVLRRSLDAAKVNGGEKLEGFRRLDRFVKIVEERRQPVADFQAVVEHELAISPSLDGRSVLDDKAKRRPRRVGQQMSLF
jgi:hypothetical protein